MLLKILILILLINSLLFFPVLNLYAQKQKQKKHKPELTDIKEESSLKLGFRYYIPSGRTVFYTVKDKCLLKPCEEYEIIKKEFINGVIRTTTETGSINKITVIVNGRESVKNGPFTIAKQIQIGEKVITTISVNDSVMKKEVAGKKSLKRNALYINDIEEKNDTIFFSFIPIDKYEEPTPEVIALISDKNLISESDTTTQFSAANKILEQRNNEKAKVYVDPFYNDPMIINSVDTEVRLDDNSVVNQFFILRKPKDTLPRFKEPKIGYASTVIGAVVIPVKYRFGYYNLTTDTIPSDVNEGINAGAYIGRRWGSLKYKPNKINTFSFTLGTLLFSPQKISINNNNTRYAFRKDKAIKDFNSLGFSFGGLAMFSFNKLNLGLIVGVDYATGKGAPRWYYQGKPWIGVAVGYQISLFK
jgi:hypothetical protein